MRAGDLKHTVQIQQLGKTPDGAGGFTEAWTTITNGERKAAIVDITSAETVARDQTEEMLTAKIFTRFFAGVTSGMRVKKKDDGRVFDIRSAVTVREARRWWVLTCLERKAA